ncbi:MAG: hypothetical protein P0121_16335 [Nitrospira sp.]|nr:hypothetical protein [Nitrospira sp.]
MPFTGTADVIRFKGLLNDVLIQNELGGAAPYALSSAKTGRSGYSFGVPQYDRSVAGSMAGNKTARNLFQDILRNATDSNGNYLIDDGNSTTSRLNDSLVDTLYNKAIQVGGASLPPSEKTLVNTALNSVYGRQEIDGALDGTLQLRIDKADGVIALATGADRTFLESALGKLFLCDYDNQFSITPGGALVKFVHGQTVFGITKQGDLGVGDLLNFYFHTQQTRQTPHDPVRRFANVVEVVGGYTPADVDDAKGVLQGYTFFVVPNKAQITSANAGALAEFMARVIDPAKAPVITAYAGGRTIDGEVLVGQDQVFPGDILEGMASGDLLFGERGNDVLRGAAGTDVLYRGEGIDTLSGDADADLLRGGAGDDSLRGGAGDDLLEGGAGFDTYYFNSLTDGNDTIEDSDATGVIKVDGHVLTGGIKKSGDSTWKSSDGQFEYRLEWGHLKLPLSGNTLTINEDFQSGQFGIHLIDAKDLSAGLPTSGRTIEGDHEPLSPPQFDEIDNPIWENPTRVPMIDHLQGSGGNDIIDAGELADWLRGNERPKRYRKCFLNKSEYVLSSLQIVRSESGYFG